MSSLKAGIIGLGFIGGADQVSGDALGQRVSDLDGTHCGAFARHPQVDLVAGSSRDAGRRERFQKRSGARTYADWHDLLDQEQLDIVSVATYAPQHAEMVEACARHRIPAIFCEKPVATRLDDAEQMIDACRESGSLLAVNHNRRFNPQYRRLRERIADGELGELTSGSVQWPSGRLGNVGTHMIDAIQMVTGQPVVAVSGTLDLTGRPDCRGPAFKDPGGWGMLRLESGLIVTVDAADHATVPARITINGTLGRAMTGGRDVVIEGWDGRTQTWKHASNEGSSMDVAVHEIVRTLADGEPFPCSATDAVRTLEVIVGFHASHRRDAAWTPLPLSGPDRSIEVLSG